MTTFSAAAGDLIRGLTYRIEDAPRTLHRDEPAGRCIRLELGLVNTRPEDCDCGLDELLAEAQRFTGSTDFGRPNDMVIDSVS